MDIEISDDGMPIQDNEPDQTDEEGEGKAKEDDTSKQNFVSKEEYDAMQARLNEVEKHNRKMSEMFTSPEFFNKLATSMKGDEKDQKDVQEDVQKKAEDLDSMDRAQFLEYTLNKVGAVASRTIKDQVEPKINQLSSNISRFIENTSQEQAQSSVTSFIERVGRAEFNKFGAEMEKAAKKFPSANLDDLYRFVSGKTAPKYRQAVPNPNSTEKPGGMNKDLTKPKDLSLEKAAEKNFNAVFDKYKK